MKEMVYEPLSTRYKEGPILLAQGNYKGYDWYVISHRTHPCAYIVLNEYDRFFRRHYDECAQINCHGGITYSENYLGSDPVFVQESDDVWVIGWDYTHCDDWWGTEMVGKKWTTEEIYFEVCDVIEQLIRLN